jgi:hypothetical protein
MIIESDIVLKEGIVNAFKARRQLYARITCLKVNNYTFSPEYFYCSYDFQNKQKLLTKAA